MAPNTTLAHTSDVLFAWAVFAYAVAMLGYAVEFAFARMASARQAQPTRSQRVASNGSALRSTGSICASSLRRSRT